MQGNLFYNYKGLKKKILRKFKFIYDTQSKIRL